MLLRRKRLKTVESAAGSTVVMDEILNKEDLHVEDVEKLTWQPMLPLPLFPSYRADKLKPRCLLPSRRLASIQVCNWRYMMGASCCHINDRLSFKWPHRMVILYIQELYGHAGRIRVSGVDLPKPKTQAWRRVYYLPFFYTQLSLR